MNQLSERELTAIRRIVAAVDDGSPEMQAGWRKKTALSLAAMRTDFGGLDNGTQALLCTTISGIIGQVADVRIADAYGVLNSIYTTYALCAAHLAGLYDAGDIGDAAETPDGEDVQSGARTGMYL